jgi:hypothetical protein
MERFALHFALQTLSRNQLPVCICSREVKEEGTLTWQARLPARRSIIAVPSYKVGQRASNILNGRLCTHSTSLAFIAGPLTSNDSFMSDRNISSTYMHMRMVAHATSLTGRFHFTGAGIAQLVLRRFDSWQRQEIFLFSTTSIPALGPTQPPIQWVPGALSPGVKRQGREADHSPPSSAKTKNGGDIPPLLQASSWRGA